MQVFCKRKTKRSKYGDNQRYEVYALMKDGRKVPLARGLIQERHALDIETALEAFLNIEDRRVPGESVDSTRQDRK